MSADGCPIWIDLACDDLDASKHFYEHVLGWSFSDPAPDAGGWTMALAGDAPVAGLAPRRAGTPSAWSLYFATADSQATLAQVPELGGTVLVPAFDIVIGGTLMGRISAAADSAGAAFGLWEPHAMTGLQPTGAPGHPVWFELDSTDPARATAFYCSLFNATTESLGDPADYTTVVIDGGQRFGIWQMHGMTPAEIGSRWYTYLSVRDVDAACERVRAQGGEVLEVQDSPHGRWAFIADNQGARVYLMDVTVKV
ncbi:MAG: VOC family protein [Actinomycetales bacterium]|nr:VOC family protein [Actinomycetales bacterium]